GHISILARALVSAPGMIRSGNLRNLLIGKLAVNAIHQRAHLARVDEKRLASSIAKATVLLTSGNEPEAHGNLRRVEELAGQRHHAIHQMRVDDVLSDFTLAGLV